MDNQQIKAGVIVMYRLTAENAEAINRRRVAKPGEPNWVPGAQAHVGNMVNAYEAYPMIVTKVALFGGIPEDSILNGQVILDGNDTLWVTNVHHGLLNGQWNWI